MKRETMLEAAIHRLSEPREGLRKLLPLGSYDEAYDRCTEDPDNIGIGVRRMSKKTTDAD